MLIEFLKNRNEAEIVLICFVVGVFILFAGVKTGQFIAWIMEAIS